ncbi:heme-binding protein [Streptomyces sp. H51]|uniref:GlcG/HbpS family heme-binding protein n=1 Tax=Streptomyces sp. H51 TaxID=3111770 RepID=UPI002D7972ED|nr:heme-binding protein [Streptomyces sp. H51]
MPDTPVPDAAAPDAPVPGVRRTATLTYAAALRVLAAAAEEAERLRVAVCVAVADGAGHPLAFGRMDGAPLMSARIAQDKAYTVAAFNGLPTHRWYDMISGEPALLHGIVHTERLVIFGGGVPVRADGDLLGAVGVSGGTAEQDRAIAEAGAAALTA